MDHAEILEWLEAHPSEVHDVPAELVSRCESAVRSHAAESAWLAAMAYVEGRMHEWEHQWGSHASESSVAKEVTALLSRELKRHEPTVEVGSEAQLAGEDVLTALEPQAREKVNEWIRELAREVEHRIWKEIVRFTRREGKKLVREHRVSDDHSWEGGENRAHKAAHVAQLLIEDYEKHLAGGKS